MICSKRILTIFFIFVLAASKSVLLGQVVIKEDIKITPGETVFNAEQSESSTVGYPCDAIIPAGDCHHFYQVVWSNSTFPLDPLQQPFNYQGNSCILDPYIGSNYDFEIISGAQYCTIYQCSRNYDEEKIDVGNSLIDISPTDFIPEGNTIQLFDGMPMNIGYCKYIIQFEDTRSRTSNVTFTFQPHGSTDLVYFHTTIIKPTDFRMELLQSQEYILHNDKMDLYLDPRRQEGYCGQFMFSNGGSFPGYLKMSAQIITGSEYGTLYYELTNTYGDYLSGLNNDEAVWFYTNGVQPADTQLVVVQLKADEYPAVDAEFYILPGDAKQLFISFASPELEPWYGTDINIKRYKNGEIIDLPGSQLLNIRITEGMEYATLVSTLDWSESNEYENIRLEYVFLAANDIPGDTARIKVYAETYVDDNGGGIATSIKEKKTENSLAKIEAGESIKEQIKLSGYGEILIVKSGARLNVSFDKNPIAPGESAKILIEGINDEGVPFNFSPDQTFYLSLGNGTLYGELFSTSTGQTGEFIGNAPGEFLFIAKDSIDVDSAFVDVYVMTEYESGDGLGKVNAAVNNRKMDRAGRIAEKFKAGKGNKEKFFLNKSTGKVSSTSETASVSEIFNLSGMARLLITEKGGDCSDAPQCEQDLIIPEIQVHPIYTNEYKGKDLCTVGVNPGGGFLPAYDNAFTYQPDPYSIVTPLKNEYYLPYEIEVCFNTNINDGDGGWQYQLYTPGISEVALGIRAFIILNCNVGDYSFPNINALNEVDPSDICMILNEFEKQRFYPYLVYGGDYDIEEIENIHEDCHIKQYEKFVRESMSKNLSFNYFGSKYIGSFYELMKFHPLCTQVYNNLENAKTKGNEYFCKLLKSYQDFIKIHFDKNEVKILGKKYNKIELDAHQSDSIQNLITKYQDRLIERARDNGIDIGLCDYVNKFMRKQFEKYSNRM